MKGTYLIHISYSGCIGIALVAALISHEPLQAIIALVAAVGLSAVVDLGAGRHTGHGSCSFGCSLRHGAGNRQADTG